MISEVSAEAICLLREIRDSLKGIQAVLALQPGRLPQPSKEQRALQAFAQGNVTLRAITRATGINHRTLKKMATLMRYVEGQ